MATKVPEHSMPSTTEMSVGVPILKHSSSNCRGGAGSIESLGGCCGRTWGHGMAAEMLNVRLLYHV
jgi:hypothetical protein